MDTAEKAKTVSHTAPAPIAKSVLAHRRILEAERDALRTGVAELALKSALGDLDARAALAAIPGKTAALQHEIDQNHAAHELAIKVDNDAEIAWRASLQTLPPVEIIAGINRDECARLCQQGIAGGCILAGGSPRFSTCLHPTRHGTFHPFHLDAVGRKVFPLRHHPRASEVFDAACAKIKLTPKEKFSND